MVPNDNSDLKIFLERLEIKADETQRSIAEMDKKIELHIQKTEFELQSINALDKQQNTLLDQHIAGVNTLKQIFEKHEKADLEQFQKLTEPFKLIKLLAQIIVGLGAVTGAIATITHFWK